MHTNPASAACPRCATLLPQGAPNGLCPACLLFQGAQPDTLAGSGSIAFEPPSVSELAPHFPQLELIELLGKGGMGAVYKARQKQLDRLVALKILPPGVGGPDFAERFVREARALAKLNHPGIITIHEFGQAGELFFFLMEYVDGANLRQLLQSGRISPREALAIVPQICDSLQFAHDHGIVHRDIKPENILIDRRNRVKIADFGLAKLMDAESAATTDLAHLGRTMGTPRYMAPEQLAQPEQVDHRADIYALGVVFYQMLTGAFPNVPAEPPSRRVSVDVRFDPVVLRALESRPEMRFQQAEEMKSRVESISHAPRNRGVLTATVAVAAIAVAGVFAFADRQTGSPSSTPPTTTAASPESGELLAQQGWQLWQKGQFVEATERFKRAVELDPKNANTWNGLGWSLFNSGHAAEAEKPFKEAVALEPGQPGALNGLGQIYLALGNFADAEKYLVQAAPTAPASWFGLSRLYMLQERFDEALPWLKKISESGQGDAAVKQLLTAAETKQLPESLRVMISPPAYAKAYPAISAAETWLTKLDESKYGESWMDASSFFKSHVTQPLWITSAENARKPFGSLISRRLQLFKSEKVLPGVPDGEYVVMLFDSELANKKSAIETVTFMRDQDGQWRAAGYFIR